MELDRRNVPLKLDTVDLPVDRRVDTWRDVMWGLCSPMTCETGDQESFGARVTATEIGPLGLRQMWSDPYRGRQTASTLAQAKKSLYVLTVTIGGGFSMTQFGRQIDLGLRNATLHSTMDELESVHDEPSSALIITVPADNLKQRIAIPEEHCALPISQDDPSASIFFEFLGSVVRQHERLSGAQRNAVAETLLDLFAMMLVSDTLHTSNTVPAVRASHLRRAKAFADTNLHCPDMTPGSIAEAIGISTRYLHELFKEEPCTVGLWLRVRRLTKARNALADHRFMSLSVAEIGYRHGFRSNAHFTTSFKNEFGITPKRWRDERLALRKAH